MRALVAGGSGFIGSHLCRKLIDDGHEVLCLDNFVTGRRVNLVGLEQHSSFDLLECDIISALPPLPRVDRIYHLASPASPPGYQLHPLETLRANSEGTLHLLEKARSDAARFLFASTSEVYGDPLEHPQEERYRGNVSSTGPRSVYDEAKRYGEALTMSFVRTFGTDGRIVRIFNTYGPNSDPNDGRLVPNIITQAISGRPITIYGDGQQTRSFCYVDDLVDGLMRLVDADDAVGEIVNLGNPDEHRVIEYAALVRELVGTRSQIVFCQPAVGDDPRRRQPDISKARTLLGWEPRVGLREGLTRTIEYFRTQLAGSGEPPALHSLYQSGRSG